MNARLLACIVMGVFTAHIGVLMVIDHLRPKPKLAVSTKPNFAATTEVIEVDAATGEKTVRREITVSTKLADPRSLEAPGQQ